jgi:hypothetical protein
VNHAPTPKHATYLRRTGVRATITPDRAAHHIHTLRTAGLRDQQISALTGVGVTTLYRIARRHGPITRATEARILTAAIPATGTTTSVATIPAVGTTRRLQALAVAGYPTAWIAQRTGIDRRNLTPLLHGHDQRTTLRTAHRITRLYLKAWDKPAEQHGVSPTRAANARRIATAHQWAPAAAWDNIDDPLEVPQLGTEVSRQAAVVEDAAELAAEGLSREGIAARLGIQWDAVRQAYRRARVALPAVLE